jgi:DNA repair exonuclease SbcCD nuclease subunit
MGNLLIVGDLHGKRSNVEIIESCLTQLFGICIEKKVEALILLGDLLDGKAVVRVEAMNLYLKYLKLSPVPVYILVGNHDYVNAIECKEHSLEIFKDIGCHVFEKGEEVEIGGINCVMEGYRSDSIVTAGNNPEKSIYFGHTEVKGYQEYGGKPSEVGIDPVNLKNFKRVFLGHIHKQYDKDNICNVGTSFTTSFGESDEEKRVVIYDTKTDTIESLQLDLPQHKTFQYSITDAQDIKELKKDLKSRVKPNYIVRLIVEAPEGIKIKKDMFEGVDSLKVISTKNRDVKSINEKLIFVDMSNKYIDLLGLSNSDEIKEINKIILGEVE